LKRFPFFLSIIILSIILPYVINSKGISLPLNLNSFTKEIEKKIGIGDYSGNIDEVIDRVIPSLVIGIASKSGIIFKDEGKTQWIGVVNGGEYVEIIKDKNYQLYYIKSFLDGKEGWVDGDILIIPPDPPTNTDKLNKKELEAYVNYNGFTSHSKYLIWVDINRQLTYVFIYNDSQWSLIKVFECSTGKNHSPTIRGTFALNERGLWFYCHRFESGAKYWIRFHGSYYFHSLPMNKDKAIIDPTLGKRSSAGCIRLRESDALWIYKNITNGTKVWIN
jgi:hypothetical protein